MKRAFKIVAIAAFGPLFLFGQTTESKTPPRPGDECRDALSKVDFVIGNWKGEGWTTPPSGQPARFVIKETYAYRGSKDLMDMEGRFADILPDGSVSPIEDYALGILFYDAGSQEYRMWHYGSNGRFFTVKMDVDFKARSIRYSRTMENGTQSKFTLTVGEDNVWVSKVEVLRPDSTWLKVMEFRMKKQ